MHRRVAPLLVTLIMTASACAVDTRSCTTELRSAVGGVVVDAEGAAVTPTTVTSMIDGEVEPCDVFDNRYDCYERGAGRYRVRIEVDTFTSEDDFDLELDDAGCHVVGPVRHDVVVP